MLRALRSELFRHAGALSESSCPIALCSELCKAPAQGMGANNALYIPPPTKYTLYRTLNNDLSIHPGRHATRPGGRVGAVGYHTGRGGSATAPPGRNT